ncbi:MAG: HAD family hydrolase [Candidatus Riflebacteria bacterium]|nr:HAD family hydrolase [Candidatus Riflebacteria bacterium]
MSKIKSIIFDLDGTLLDTLDDLTDSLNSVLEQFNLSTHTREACRMMIGSGMDTLIRRAIPENQFSQNLHSKVLEAMEKEYSQRWHIKTCIFSQIPETLDFLEQNNIMFSILSNKPHNFTELNVRKFFHKWNFRQVLGARKDFPKKPDPTQALLIAENTGTTPAETFFVGDSDVDMHTASNAKMISVGALWGFRSESELKAAGAKFLIKSPIELISLIADY